MKRTLMFALAIIIAGLGASCTSKKNDSGLVELRKELAGLQQQIDRAESTVVAHVIYQYQVVTAAPVTPQPEPIVETPHYEMVVVVIEEPAPVVQNVAWVYGGGYYYDDPVGWRTSNFGWSYGGRCSGGGGGGSWSRSYQCQPRQACQPRCQQPCQSTCRYGPNSFRVSGARGSSLSGGSGGGRSSGGGGHSSGGSHGGGGHGGGGGHR